MSLVKRYFASRIAGVAAYGGIIFKIPTDPFDIYLSIAIWLFYQGTRYPFAKEESGFSIFAKTLITIPLFLSIFLYCGIESQYIWVPALGIHMSLILLFLSEAIFDGIYLFKNRRSLVGKNAEQGAAANP